MGGRRVPRRTVVALRVLQTSCGVLAVAALVALGQTPPPIAAHDGARTVASAHPAVPTEWSNAAGPLAIPTIGVVPPGSEDWFDPSAEPTFRARDTLPTDVTMPPPPEAPAPTPDEPTPTTPPATPSSDANPAPTTEPPQPTGTTVDEATPPSTTTPGITAPGTTGTRHDDDRNDDRRDRTRGDDSRRNATTTPETSTSQTSDPDTTTPPTASPGTTTPPTTEETTPESTSPSTTAPLPTQEPAPTTPPAPTATPVQTNARGNVVLGFGEELTLFDDVSGAAALAVAVDGVATDLTCSAPAVNGHLVAVTVRATTGADLAAVGGAPAIRATAFRFLAEDGARFTELATPSADSCLPAAKSFPAGPLAPGQELSGVVVLDLPPTAGRLVFSPAFLSVGAEWKYAPPAR
jgi:hypothetical protein